MEFIGFSERMKAIIDGKGLSQKAAAAYLNIAETQLSRYLRGQVPDPQKLVRIAEWGGVSIDWLLSGKDPLQRMSELLLHQDKKQSSSAPVIASDDGQDFQDLALLWSKLDQPARQRLLYILTNFKAANIPVLDSLEILLQVLALQGSHPNRKVRIQKSAMLWTDVNLLCGNGLTPKDRKHFSKEVERRSKVLRKRVTQARASLGKTVGSIDKKVQLRLRRAFKKISQTLEQVFEDARSKKPSQEVLVGLSNECLAIAKIYPDGELSLVNADTSQIEVVKMSLLQELGDLHKTKMTKKAWEEWKRKMIHRLTGLG